MTEPRDEPEVIASRAAGLRLSLKRMAWLSLVVGLLAVAFVVAGTDAPSIHLILATFILAAGSMIVATFLMTLIWFSANSGHDARAHEFQRRYDPGERPK